MSVGRVRLVWIHGLLIDILHTSAGVWKMDLGGELTYIHDINSPNVQTPITINKSLPRA